MGEAVRDWQVLQRADGSRTNQQRDALLYWQSSLWEDVWKSVAEPLANGELFALAIGCDVWRGCQPHSEASGRREFCLIASVGLGLTEEAPRQGEHENQTLRSDLGCCFLGGNPQTRVVI